jgi:hypothetical protein
MDDQTKKQMDGHTKVVKLLEGGGVSVDAQVSVARIQRGIQPGEKTF